MATNPNPPVDLKPNPPADPSQDFYAYYRFDPKRDWPNDARNTLLVVGALIAAATFQAGVNPPGGVWQDKTTVDGVTTHPGKAILGSNRVEFTVFLFLNTLALSASLHMISHLIIGCPFSLEVLTAIYCMFFTYVTSVAAVNPPGSHASWVLLIGVLPYVLRFSRHFWKKYKNRG